jgi:hypothetical protein
MAVLSKSDCMRSDRIRVQDLDPSGFAFDSLQLEPPPDSQPASSRKTVQFEFSQKVELDWEPLVRAGTVGFELLLRLSLPMLGQVFQPVFERRALLYDRLQFGDGRGQFALFHHAIGQRVGDALQGLTHVLD